MIFSTETGNLTPFLRLSDPVYHYTFGYYSNNSWVNDHQIILGRFKSSDPTKPLPDSSREVPGETQLVLADLEKQTETLLPLPFTDFVVHQNHLYYVKGGQTLCHMDLDSGAQSELCTSPRMSFPHMTADGNYLNWHQLGTETEPDTGMRINLKTGAITKFFEKRFSKPFSTANHMMICPTNPDLMFFSHEGTTEYVSNRLWLASPGKEPFHIAKQELNKSGDLGDCFGHECWAPDGKGLYFVKYPCSPEPPRGICYVTLDDPDAHQILYSKYRYWHVSASPNGRYLGSDTQDGDYSGVCLIDQETGTEQMLVKARCNWVHPCHPHPHFNPGSTGFAFHELDEQGQVTVGIIHV